MTSAEVLTLPLLKLSTLSDKISPRLGFPLIMASLFSEIKEDYLT